MRTRSSLRSCFSSFEASFEYSTPNVSAKSCDTNQYGKPTLGGCNAKCVSANGADKALSSARRFLHERDNPRLVGGGQRRQCIRRGPHGAVVELRFVAEA